MPRAAQTDLLLLAGVACTVSACVRDEIPGAAERRLDSPAVEWVLQGLLSNSPSARRKSFELIERHWTQLRSDVIDLVNSKEVPKRYAAAYLLSRLGGRQDAPQLRDCLRDDAAAVRLAALHGVERIRDRSSLPVLRANLDRNVKFVERRAILRVIVRFDTAAAREVCMKYADRKSWAHRRIAAQIMGYLEDEDSNARLLRMLDDRVWTVRTDAAQSLAKRGEVSVRPRLLRMTEERGANVRVAAARALGILGRPEDLVVLRKLRSNDPDRLVRAAAAHVLEDRSPSARPLMESSKD